MNFGPAVARVCCEQICAHVIVCHAVVSELTHSDAEAGQDACDMITKATRIMAESKLQQVQIISQKTAFARYILVYFGKDLPCV